MFFTIDSTAKSAPNEKKPEDREWALLGARKNNMHGGGIRLAGIPENQAAEGKNS
jgi:hypothetical protein